MRLIVLTTRLFRQPAGGGEIGTARLLECLRDAGHRVTLVGRGDAAAAAAWCDKVHSLGPVELPFSEQARVRRLLSIVGALARGEAVTVHRLGGRVAARAVRPWLEGDFDGCVVDHLQAWPWLGNEPPLPTLLINHNVESDNYQRLARAANRGCQGNQRTRHLERAVMRREAHTLRLLELRALQQATVVASVSAADAERLAQIAASAGSAASARLHVLPLYPLNHPGRAVVRADAAGMRRIGLLGNWTWAPNRAALQWMLHSVWPHLQGRCRLVLAGSGIDGLKLPAEARLLGRVDDVADFYRAVDVVAIPSLHGSGVQEKAIEAIGRGATVVATAHALRGLGPGLPACVHSADHPAEFARLCAEVAVDGASQPAAADWSARRRAAFGQVLSQSLQTLKAAPPTAAARRWASAAARS